MGCRYCHGLECAQDTKNIGLGINLVGWQMGMEAYLVHLLKIESRLGYKPMAAQFKTRGAVAGLAAVEEQNQLDQMH